MNYGIPYKGSKNKLAARIVDLLPSAPCIVDLFAGGCAVTHAAILSGKFGHVIANDINPAPITFEFPEIKLDMETGKAIKEDFETHREKTWRHDNFEMFLSVPDDEKTPEWGFPILPAVDVKPEHGMIAFSEMLASTDYDAGVHFFIDDYRFERCWVSPEKYAHHLAKHPFIIQPDFSTYTDMPKVMQMWNKWRNHMLAWYWSGLGITVVPNVMFSDEASWEWCFDGIPTESTVCISNVGCMQNKYWAADFLVGMQEAIRRLKPLQILFYGKIPKDYDFGSIEVMEFKTNSFRGKKKEEV